MYLNRIIQLNGTPDIAAQDRRGKSPKAYSLETGRWFYLVPVFLCLKCGKYVSSIICIGAKTNLKPLI